MNNKLCRKYIASVRRSLPSSCRNKQAYIKNLAESVQCYCSEHSEVSMEKLEATFGTPEEIAESFSQEQSGEAIIRERKLARRRRICLLAAFLLLLALGIFLAVFLGNENGRRKGDGNLVTEKEEAFHLEETIVRGDLEEIDLTGQSASYPVSEEGDSLAPAKATKIRAAKEVSCLDAEGDVVWYAEITADFLIPDSAVSALAEAMLEEPQIHIEVLDDSWQVEADDTIHTNNLTQVTFLIQYQGEAWEETVSFSCDEEGALE